MRVAALSLASLASLAAGAPGYSFVFVRPPHHTHVDDCTESYAAPVVDTILAAPGAAAAAYAIMLFGAMAAFPEPTCPTHDCGDPGIFFAAAAGAGVLGLVETLPLIISAHYGYARVAQCREEPHVLPPPPPPAPPPPPIDFPP